MAENTKKNKQEEETDFGPDIVTLTDEEGKEQEYELIDELETDHGNYVALLECYDPSKAKEFLNSDGNIIILKVAEEQGDDTYLDAIEDDDEYEEVASIFQSRLSDMFDFDAE